jgi:hypothetical protein
LKTRPPALFRYLLAIVCIAIVTLYVASQRWNFFAQVPLFSLEIMGGVFDLHRGGVPSWSITDHNWPWRHVYAFKAGGGYWEIKFPLYVPLIPMMVLTATAWTRRHGALHDHRRAPPVGAPVGL